MRDRTFNLSFVRRRPRGASLAAAVLCAAIVCAASIGGGCERRENASAAAREGDGADPIVATDAATPRQARAIGSDSIGSDAPGNDTPDADAPDPEYGKQTFASTCATCHGTRGQGMPHQGASLRESKFIASADDNALLRFLQTGRPANDPANRSGMPMPPRGGNISLSDARLRDVIAYLRTVQREAERERGTPAPGAEASGRD
jgi:mono/diheme cytochrome c family protein